MKVLVGWVASPGRRASFLEHPPSGKPHLVDDVWSIFFVGLRKPFRCRGGSVRAGARGFPCFGVLVSFVSAARHVCDVNA